MDLGNIYWGNLAEIERRRATKSSKTTESIVKLVKESLEMERVLGMTSIDKEEEALERIKRTLKKE